MSAVISRVCLTTVLIVLLLAGCADEGSPEFRLRQTLEAMETAIEAGKRDEFMESVDDDFTGSQGRFDRRGLSAMLRVQLMRHTRIGALTSNVEITLYDTRATVTMNLLLTGGPRAWMPESGQMYRVDTGWKDDGGDWMLISADWEPVY